MAIINGGTVKNKGTLLVVLQLSLILAASFGCTGCSARIYETEVKCDEFWLVTYDGTSITFDIQVRNLSPIHDSYTFYIDNPPLPENWTANFYLQNKKIKGFVIKSRQLVDLVLEVDVPEDAAPRDYDLKVYANGTRSIGSIVLTVTVEREPSVPYETCLACPSSWQMTYPGKSLTFNIQLKNLGPEYDSYSLYIDNPPLPEEWAANFYLQNRKVKGLVVESQQLVDLVLEVEVPEDAIPRDYEFVVYANGTHSIGTLDLTVTVESTPPIPHKIELTCPSSWQITYPETSVTFNIQLKNTGPYDDSYTLYIDNPPLPEDWTTHFYLENRKVKELIVESQQLVNLVLELEIPEDTAARDYAFRVYADGTRSIGTLDLTVTVETKPTVPPEIELACSSSWQIAYSGTSVTFNIQLKNVGPEYDSYSLYIDNPPLPENWTADFYVDDKNVKEAGIGPEGTINLALELSVPENATPSDYRLRVHIDGNYASATQAFMVTVRGIPRKIELACPFQSKTALTGQGLSYPIKAVNEGGQTEKIFLEVNRTADMMVWDISFSEKELTLPPKGAEWVTLSVKSPGIVETGRYPLNVTASTEDGELNRTLPIFAEIVADYLLEIIDVQPINPEVVSGERIDILVTVRNLGQSPITRIRLDVNSTAIPNIFTTPVDVLALEPMSSVHYYVTVSPETRLTPGDYLIEVQAESVETQSSVRGFVVSVVSPIPWFWISIAITIIATSLAIIAIEKWVSKHGIRIRARK